MTDLGDPFLVVADQIHATFEQPGAYPLGREALYAQMLGNAEQALRHAAKLLAEHRECMPRADVEEILKSKLPCGHPDACAVSNATGSRIRCAWCDEVKALKDRLGELGGFDYSRRPVIAGDPAVNEYLHVWWDKWSIEEKKQYWVSLGITAADAQPADYREPMTSFKCARCGMSYTSFPPAECPLCHNTLDQVTA